MIQIQVLYATQEIQEPIFVELAEGATLSAAIEASKVFEIYPCAVANPQVFGVFGRIIHDPSRYVLDDGDRVEVYRPLLIDPKEGRRLRAGSS